MPNWMDSVEMVLRLKSSKFQRGRCPCRCVLTPTASPYVYEASVVFPALCEPNIDPGFRQRVAELENALLENDIVAFRPNPGKVLVCYPVPQHRVTGSEQVVVHDVPTAVFVTADNDHEHEVARDVVGDGDVIVYWVDPTISTDNDADVKMSSKRRLTSEVQQPTGRRRALYIGSGMDMRMMHTLRRAIKDFVYVDTAPYSMQSGKVPGAHVGARLHQFETQLTERMARFGFAKLVSDKLRMYDRYKFRASDGTQVEYFSGVAFPHVPDRLMEQMPTFTDLILVGYDPSSSVLTFIGHPVNVITHLSTEYFEVTEPSSTIHVLHSDPTWLSSVTFLYPRWNVFEPDYVHQPGHSMNVVESFRTLDDVYWFAHGLKKSNKYNDWLQISLEDADADI